MAPVWAVASTMAAKAGVLAGAPSSLAAVWLSADGVVAPFAVGSTALALPFVALATIWPVAGSVTPAVPTATPALWALAATAAVASMAAVVPSVPVPAAGVMTGAALD